MTANLYVTEVTKKTTATGEVVVIAHGTDKAVNKSTINAEAVPLELFTMLDRLNEHFRTICPFGDNTNYALTGFKVRDAKSGHQEIQFTCNIRTEIVAFEDVKTLWMEVRMNDLRAIEGGSYEVRKNIRAVNGIVEEFNAIQELCRDNIAEWLDLSDAPKPVFDLFSQPAPKPFEKDFLSRNDAAEAFHDTLKGLTQEGVNLTISSGGRSVTFGERQPS